MAVVTAVDVTMGASFVLATTTLKLCDVISPFLSVAKRTTS